MLGNVVVMVIRGAKYIVRIFPMELVQVFHCKGLLLQNTSCRGSLLQETKGKPSNTFCLFAKIPIVYVFQAKMLLKIQFYAVKNLNFVQLSSKSHVTSRALMSRLISILQSFSCTLSKMLTMHRC